MNNFKFIFLLSIFAFTGCSQAKVVENVDFISETEPNNELFQANEIEEGVVYKGLISKPVKDNADKDVFKTWKPAGTLIAIEFESDESDFSPYIGHTDNLSHAQFITFNSPGKFRAEVITSIDGWQYFEIGDRRNTIEDAKKKGGYDYYFRVASTHICENKNYDEIKDMDKIERSFRNGISGVDILKMNISENGIYQIRVLTERMVSDKFTFVFSCDSGRSVAGNDDEDYYSDLMDPLIYSGFESNLTSLIVTGRLLTDLDARGTENFSVALSKQPENRELEPNNLYNYANILTSDKIEGNLSKELQMILGEQIADQDWFKVDLARGDVIDFSITTENGKAFTSEIWAGSYPQTGTSIMPLRFNKLSGSETHRMNMMMPFSGAAYLLLNGKDVPYSVKIKTHSDIPEAQLFKETVFEIIETKECEWQFFSWNMPDHSELFEISLESLTNYGGIHIFSSDHKPFAFLEPSEISRFFIHRSELTKRLFFGIYFGECEQGSDETMTFKVTDISVNFIKWEEQYVQDAVKYSDNGSYQGFLDTDSLLVENFFEIKVPYDGILYLATSPYLETTSFDIDTVITLYKGKEIVSQNDDVISFINYNRYSYIKHQVKQGEKYTVKVMPFMTESSHIPSMKITGHYILDIIIK